MRVMMHFSFADGSRVVEQVIQETSVPLSYYAGGKVIHFDTPYDSYEEAAEALDRVEKGIRRACCHPFVSMVRPHGAKGFMTEREYALMLVRAQKELRQKAEPLAELAKTLATV